jgi:GcrA cell cycle regulator
VAQLRRLWETGASARRIAGELGAGVSRSAVLGKIHRLGIAALAPRIARRPAGGTAAPARLPWSVPPEPADCAPWRDDPGADADIPRPQRRSLLTLTAATCRWPVGDPARPGFFFCGAPSEPRRPYCRAHALRARSPEPAAAPAPAASAR